MRRPSVSLVLAVLVLALAALQAQAQRIVLRDGRSFTYYAPRAGFGYWSPPAGSTLTPTQVEWTALPGGAYRPRTGIGGWQRGAGRPNSNTPTTNTWVRTTRWQAGPSGQVHGIWYAPYPGTGPTRPQENRWTRAGSAGHWLTFISATNTTGIQPVGRGLGYWGPGRNGPGRPENNTTWRITNRPPSR
jgi:hypothetical protein